MSLSFILWFLISSLLLGFWFWTSYILFRQKRAWKFYAEKKKLRYYSNRFYDGPSMSGAIDEYKISIFTSEHSELDARSQRRLTAVEINLHTGLSVHSALASGGMVPVVEALNFNHEYKPQIKGWEDSYVVRTADSEYAQEYLNADRLNKVIGLMGLDKVWVMLLFFDGAGLLRLDTPQAVDDPKKMDALIKQLLDVARTLELVDGEERSLQRKRSKSGDKNQVLNIDDDLLNDDIGFELEDDQ